MIPLTKKLNNFQITRFNKPEILIKEGSSECEKECQKDIDYLQEIWKKKNKRNQKDKTFIQRKANSNENNTNEENNASNTEENSNKRNEERRDIHLIQGETIHTTKIKIDPKMEATIKIPQKTTMANVIYHAKGNT